MKVVYVARSFLDYRIPVLEAIHKSCDGGFRFIFSEDYVPRRCAERLRGSLGPSAIGLRGEWRIGPNETAGFANRGFRLVHQPGLWKAIAASEPDVLVGDGFFQWTGAALGYRIVKNVGLVVCYERTFHTERRAQWLRTVYRRRVMRWVDAMACNGELSRDYSIHLGMTPDRITVGQMAADSHRLVLKSSAVTGVERMATRQRWGSPQVAFIAVGRLNERKGIRELLDGWALLERRQSGNWCLVIVGDGPDQAALKARAEQLGLRHVIFMGHVDYDGVAELYAAADVMVMPTLEDNWSLVVPEAMACGLPVLCSRYNGCHPELVSEGRNGWVFDPLSADDTYRVLKLSVDSRASLRLMGIESRTIAASFTPEHAADAILKACRVAYEASTARRRARSQVS